MNRKERKERKRGTVKAMELSEQARQAVYDIHVRHGHGHSGKESETRSINGSADRDWLLSAFFAFFAVKVCSFLLRGRFISRSSHLNGGADAARIVC